MYINTYTHPHPHPQDDSPEQLGAHLYKSLRICTLENHAQDLETWANRLVSKDTLSVEDLIMNHADFVDVSTFHFVDKGRVENRVNTCPL